MQKPYPLVIKAAVSPEDSWGFSPTGQSRGIDRGEWGCSGGRTQGEVPTSAKWEVSRLPTKTRHEDCGQLCESVEKQMEKQNWGVS